MRDRDANQRDSGRLSMLLACGRRSVNVRSFALGEARSLSHEKQRTKLPSESRPDAY
jgi:hypothetical protein